VTHGSLPFYQISFLIPPYSPSPVVCFSSSHFSLRRHRPGLNRSSNSRSPKAFGARNQPAKSNRSGRRPRSRHASHAKGSRMGYRGVQSCGRRQCSYRKFFATGQLGGRRNQSGGCLARAIQAARRLHRLGPGARAPKSRSRRGRRTWHRRRFRQSRQCRWRNPAGSLRRDAHLGRPVRRISKGSRDNRPRP
jgi:hypothetical protein